MTKYGFQVTIGAAAVRLSVAAITAGSPEGCPAIASHAGAIFSDVYLPFFKIGIQVLPNSAGEVYIGPSTVTNAGVNAEVVLDPALASAPSRAGGSYTHDAGTGQSNALNLADFWIHGTVPGDVVAIVWYQK